MKRFATLLILAAVGWGVFGKSALGADQLSKADRELLRGLIGKPLTDVYGKRYGLVTVVARDCWGGAERAKVAAWYQPAQGETAARVFFTDGDWIEAPQGFEERDFVAESKELLNPPASNDEDDFPEAFRRMRQIAAGSAGGVPLLARAAWLVQVGHDDLAAKIVAQLKSDTSRYGREPENETPEQRVVRRLTADLAWRAYADAVHAYMQGADEEALRHAARLIEKYPPFATEFGDGDALLVELKRRQQAGTLGEEAPKKPDDFDKWDAPRQARWLIDQLDQVDARQWSQPGGVHLAGDWRVEALIAVGDPAVEPLIRALEEDTRLTRSVHFWRDFARSRTVLSVREAVLSAVMSILKVRVFEPTTTGDNFTSRGDEAAIHTAERLRKYWKKYGSLPFEDRMMAVLTNPASTPDALREAAINIGRINEQRTISTTVFTDVTTRDGSEPPPNPAIKKFANPTAAEAILAAMDRDLTQHDQSQQGDSLWDYRRRQIEATYLGAVTMLGDDRILPELRTRGDKAKTVRMRRQCALAAHELGNSELINAFAAEFQAGKIAIPANDREQTNWDDQPGTVELAGIVRALAQAETPAADAALMALTDAKHPGYAIASQAVRSGRSGWSDEATWFAHPYCITLLREALDDPTPTGTIAEVTDQGQYIEKYGNGSSTSGIPELIADPSVRRDRAELRVCDETAKQLDELVIGLPPYHPLLKDAERLVQMRKLLDKKAGSIRRATREEREKHDHHWGPAYVLE